MPARNDNEFEDSIERDGGVFVGRRVHIDPQDEDEGRELDLGEDRDPELWGEQGALIEEDVRNAVVLEGFDDAAAATVMDTLGDEVADPLQDSPNGVSATGSPFAPEHGGFPERD